MCVLPAGPGFAIFSVIQLLLPVMSLWLQRSHGDHSYWDVAAANFKHAIGLCCELVVEHVNSFIHSGVCVCVCVCKDGLCLIAQLTQEVSGVFSSLPQSPERPSHSHPHRFLCFSFPSGTWSGCGFLFFDYLDCDFEEAERCFLVAEHVGEHSVLKKRKKRTLQYKQNVTQMDKSSRLTVFVWRRFWDESWM